MNTNVATVLEPRVSLEAVNCPRCGCSEGRTVTEGKDYLYGVPGDFYAWQCGNCRLQYQNPRPTVDQLSRLYPSSYGPHGRRQSQNTKTSRLDHWKQRLKRHPAGNSISQGLSITRAQLRSMRRRAGLVSRRPVPSEMRSFLGEHMGYTHLGTLEAITRSSLSRSMVRECRRKAGIDLIPYFVSGGRLLEIGCAAGQRLQAYHDHGWRDLHGIELTQQAAMQAQQRGFAVVCDQVERALDRFSDGSFDVIVSSMVIEHLYDPFSLVRSVARKLKPRGQFLFSTVTRDALDARLFGKYWSGYDFPRHMVYLTLVDIEDMVWKDFEQLERFHQNAPIDFLRPATWRRPEEKLSDRLIATVAKSKLGPIIGEALARMGQTCRVSLRCRKKL